MNVRLIRNDDHISWFKRMYSYGNKSPYKPKIYEIKQNNELLEIICECPKAEYLPCTLAIFSQRLDGEWDHTGNFLKIDEETSGVIIKIPLVKGLYKLEYVDQYHRLHSWLSKESIIIPE